MAKKTVVMGLMAYAAALYTPISTLSAAQPGQTIHDLQPQALNHAGIHALRQLDPDLTGSGIKFGIICRSITYLDGEPQNDYRPDTQHNCFAGRQFTFHDQGQAPAGISPHSTAVCSILLGEDSDAFSPLLGQFRYQGTTPQAQADIYEFWHFLINHVFPQSPPDADVVTASIGNQFEDWWTRGLEALVEHHGLIIVAGIGNGLDVHDPPLYPGAGANIIGVGVVDSVNTDSLATNLAHFALAYPQHSSFGPAADGRCKPDIVAPGNCLAAVANDPQSYEPTGSWSSFSTPIVAGTIGLLAQKAKQDPNLDLAVSPTGGNCVLKAILLNSATKLPYWHKGRLQADDDHSAPLDLIQGAGMLNAVAAYRHLVAGPKKPGTAPTTGWDNNLLGDSKTHQNIYKITLTNPAHKLITATVVWNRHYSTTYPFKPIPEKDANLQLELWAVDANDPNSGYMLDYSDSAVDNLEHIYHRADANYTDYEIVVSYSDVTDAGQPAQIQRYGLAWNVSDRETDDNVLWYDLNADGIVNESDFMILGKNWLSSLQSPEGYLLGDINSDGEIEVNDFQIFLNHMNLKADWHPTEENKPE